MEKVNPSQALFIKLGEKGKFEAECLADPGVLHGGWRDIDHDLCMSGNWERVWQQNFEHLDSDKTTATNRTNQIRHFYESGEDVIWITFYKDCLYWCNASKEINLTPEKDKFRSTLSGWHNCDIDKGVLSTDRLSGSLLAVQGFRGTICKVQEKDYLIRKINCETSPEEQQAVEARKSLVQSLMGIIHHLNWKEFELLVDLIFRQAGLLRVGPVGRTTKSIDLHLNSGVFQEKCKVQIKSSASQQDLEAFLDRATSGEDHTRLFFVVHNPTENLCWEEDNPLIQVWLAEDVARYALDYGLTNWLIDKAK